MQESNYDKFVMGQTMGKFGVICVHLWLEHLLAQCLRVVVPNPEPLFRDRAMGFSQLVSICEAHRIVDKPLADVLRSVNALRNKCAHQLVFNPGQKEWEALDAQVMNVVPPNTPSNGEGPLRALAEFLEQKAVAMGALPANAG